MDKYIYICIYIIMYIYNYIYINIYTHVITCPSQHGSSPWVTSHNIPSFQDNIRIGAL